MPGGQLWGMLFFIFMSFAALTTVIAVLENIVAYGIDVLKWTRKKAVTVNFVLVFLLSLPCALGFNVLSGIQPFGPGSMILDLEDFIVSNNLLPLGSMVFLFFGRNLYGLFSSEQEILDMGVMIMRMLCVIIYLQITQVIFFGCLRGAGDTKYTAFASMISVAIIRPGLSWLLCYPLGLGLLGVWLGLFGDQFMRFCLGYFRMKQGKWLKIKI